jgi:hypothetical protein
VGCARWAHAWAAGATKVVLPNAFTDLPSAIAAAQQQGMQLPLKSAMLVMEGPRGKPPVAVWTLQPKIDRSGRVESYFIAAADGGRPLTLNDISDGLRITTRSGKKLSISFTRRPKLSLEAQSREAA